MSRQALFGDCAARVLEAQTLDELKQVLYDELMSAKEFNVRTPLVFHNHTNEPGIKIVNTGRDDHVGILIQDGDGRQTQVGIGLGNKGIVASEIVPDRNFTLDPAIVNRHYQGQAVQSGYGVGSSGSGLFGTIHNFLAKAGWGRLLDSIHKSLFTWHPPTTADQLSMNGNKKWWPTDPLGWCVLHCRVTAVNADTLTCTVIDDSSGTDPAGILGSSITVCKPWWLMRSPFDGLTVDGITYTYSAHQTRTANDGVTTETQRVHPGYKASDTYADPSEIYVRWSGNGTDVASTWYIDVNADARTWVVV